MLPRSAFVVLLCLLAGLWIGTLPPTAAAQTPPATRPPGQLAPGVLTVIPPAPREGETFTGPLPIVELMAEQANLDWTPTYYPKSETLLEMAKKVTFRREIWNLEFAFKPLRMIEIDVPQPTGRMQRKLIWYMVYRVRYLGYELNPKAEQDQWGHTTFPATEPVNRQSRRFFPSFVLKSQEFNKSYLDRVIPAAMEPIRRREMPPAPLHDSVQITSVDVPLSDGRIDQGVWGVVTWEDVDPRIDYLSVFVQGLTNAFQFEDVPGAYTKGDPPGTGRTFLTKTLQLNFWRPGDTKYENEKEIRFGIPVDPDMEEQDRLLRIFGVPERLDHLWVYR